MKKRTTPFRLIWIPPVPVYVQPKAGPLHIHGRIFFTLSPFIRRGQEFAALLFARPSHFYFCRIVFVLFQTRLPKSDRNRSGFTFDRFAWKFLGTIKWKYGEKSIKVLRKFGIGTFTKFVTWSWLTRLIRPFAREVENKTGIIDGRYFVDQRC